jgi:hypothetical protein
MNSMAMHRVWRLLLLLTGLVPAAASADDLKPFSASYAISWNGLSGSSRVQLERLADGRWAYSSETTTPRWIPHFLLPGEVFPRRSVFRFQNDTLIPETFTVDDGTSSESKDQNIVFDWSAGRVQGTAERKPVDLPTQPGLLDELSIHVALMHALLMGHTPDHFIIVDGNRVKDYMYTAEGKERLTTSVGEYDTVIFRSSREGSRKTTWFWCAPELGYLPLKVEGRDGRSVEMTMRVQQVTR